MTMSPALFSLLFCLLFTVENMRLEQEFFCEQAERPSDVSGDGEGDGDGYGDGVEMEIE